MKLVIGMIQPNRLEDIQHALNELGINRLTSHSVRGYGKQKGHKALFRGREYEVVLTKKSKIQILTKTDKEKENAITGIILSCWTGTIGDGKIYTLPVEEVICIRTGEKGLDAI